MNLISFNHHKTKRYFNRLIKAYAKELMSKKPTKGFKAISIYIGWQRDIREFLVKRIDVEVLKNNDFIIISDIKHNRCNQLCISYISILGLDYDGFIERLVANEKS